MEGLERLSLRKSVSGELQRKKEKEEEEKEEEEGKRERCQSCMEEQPEQRLGPGNEFGVN